MQLAKLPLESTPSGPAPRANRVLANRQLWKNAIYGIALVTYICSFLFFGLAVAAVRQGSDVGTAVIDMLVALYFLLQVVFLFILSTVVERRRQSLPITFANRRK